jgi:hypothetical protein
MTPSKNPMPKSQSKKTTHKKTAHAHTKKHVPKSVQQDITNAVNSLPSLLADQASWNTLTTQHTDVTNTTPDTNEPPRPSMIPQSNTPYQPPQHSGVLLVLGVALLMTTILGLWAWNMKSMVNNVFAAPSAEKQILANVGDDFGDILNHIEEQDSISAKLDEIQAQAMAALSASTTPSTTTQTDLKAAFSNILNSTTTTSTP